MPELANHLDGPWWLTTDKKGQPILDPARHYRLIQQRHAVAQRAGLGAAYMSAIWEPLPLIVSKAQRQWLVNTIYKRPQHRVFRGGNKHVAECFRALVGALIRNEVDARLMTVEEIVQIVMEGDALEAGVLFISDFAVEDEPRSEPVKRKITGVIRQRVNAGLPTALYVSNLVAVSKTYGAPFAQEISPPVFDVETLV